MLEKVLFEFPSDLAISSIDAEKHPDIRQFTKGLSELVQLALWLLAERQKGEQSPWYPFLRTLPVCLIYSDRLDMVDTVGSDPVTHSVVE